MGLSPAAPEPGPRVLNCPLRPRPARGSRHLLEAAGGLEAWMRVPALGSQAVGPPSSESPFLTAKQDDNSCLVRAHED